MNRILVVLAMSLLAANMSATAAAAARQSAPTAIVNVTVIPMETEVVIPDGVVVVEGDRIVAVGAASDVVIPDDAVVIDGGGGFLIPGLADMHYHVDGQRNNLLLAVAAGVTTVQNLNANEGDLALAAEIGSGERFGPRLITGLHTIGLPSYLRVPYERIDGSLAPWLSLLDHANTIPGVPMAGVSTDGVAARAYVAKAVEEGTDFFKTNLYLGREAFDTIVEEAATRNMKVQGHVTSEVGLEHYINSGGQVHHFSEVAPYLSTDAEQGVPLQTYDFALADERIPALVQLMVDNEMWFTPTVNLGWYLNQYFVDYDSLFTGDLARYLEPAVVLQASNPDNNPIFGLFGTGSDAAASAADYGVVQEEFIRAAHAAGVPLLAGTDASAAPGSVRGFDLHLELATLVSYGLTPYEALAAATRLPAEFYDEGGKWGTLTVGSEADMVLLGSNPLDDITATLDIEGVVLAGAWYPAADLQTMLDEVAAEYEAQLNISLEPYTSEALGLSGLVPAGWTELDTGVWTRSDPDSDPTFLVQQAAPAADADGLVGGILGEFGASDLGEAVDSFEIEGVAWELFAPQAELGILLARSFTDDLVLVVALATTPDQLDGLAGTVLQPVVGALRPDAP